MPLTDKQRTELEALGVANVQMKLAQIGYAGAVMLRGVTDEMPRGDLEDWLTAKMVERDRLQAVHQAETLRLAQIAAEQQIVAVRCAKIAGWAAGFGIVVSIVIAGLQWLLAPK